MSQATHCTGAPRLKSALVTRGDPQPTLTILRGPQNGRSYALVPREAPYVLGRGDDAHVVVPDDTVSRAHAEFRVVGQTTGPASVSVRDLGSTNGTWVNGDRVTEVALVPGDKVQVGDVVLRLDLLDRVDPSYLDRVRQTVRAAVFEAALDSVHLVYQPIVSWSARRPIGWEALFRTDAALLPSPLAMLDAAKRLGRLWQLGRALRERAAAAVEALPEDGSSLFVNVHADDLEDEELYDAKRPLSRVASRVVLELTERSSLALVDRLEDRVSRLRGLGYRIAIDDLGAGYSSLTSIAWVAPDLVKVDMDLVRGIDADPTRASLVKSVVNVCRETGVHLVAEGIETEAERRAIVEMGCDLLQGFLIARPEPRFATPSLGG